MEAHTSSGRGGTRTQTIDPAQAFLPPPLHKAVLITSFCIVLVATISGLYRAAYPHSHHSHHRHRDHHPPPHHHEYHPHDIHNVNDDAWQMRNVSSLTDLMRSIFDIPYRGVAFQKGCFRRQSLRCYNIHHVSDVLDEVQLSDDGDDYVFRISKQQLRKIRHLYRRRQQIHEGCIPWYEGSLITKLEWYLWCYLPETLVPLYFGQHENKYAFERHRWGWCTSTIPFTRIPYSPLPDTYPHPEQIAHGQDHFENRDQRGMGGKPSPSPP